MTAFVQLARVTTQLGLPSPFKTELEKSWLIGTSPASTRELLSITPSILWFDGHNVFVSTSVK